MKRLFVLVPPALLLFIATACSPATVDIADYDRTCGQDTECLAVPIGDPCSCACSFSALNGKDAPAYMSEWNSEMTTCAAADVCKACPAAPIASCKSGKCAVQ